VEAEVEAELEVKEVAIKEVVGLSLFFFITDII
jgi:hypothetical protein